MTSGEEVGLQEALVGGARPLATEFWYLEEPETGAFEMSKNRLPPHRRLWMPQFRWRSFVAWGISTCTTRARGAFLQVQEREVYCFAAGAPVVSTVVLSLSSGAWPWGHHSDAVRRWRNHQLSRTDRAIRAESVEGRVSLWRKEVGAEWCGTTHGFHGTQASTSWAMTRSKFKKQFSSGTPVKVPGEKRFYRRRFGPRVL